MESIETLMNYNFKNKKLLENAYSGCERLAFRGNGIFFEYITDYLFKNAEKTKYLNSIRKKIMFKKMLLRKVEKNINQNNLISIIGALYVDSEKDTVFIFLNKIFSYEIDIIINKYCTYIEIEVEHETELYIYFYVLINEKNEHKRMPLYLWKKNNLNTSERLIQYIEKSKYDEWIESNIIEEM